jgi:hypothetical protein
MENSQNPNFYLGKIFDATSGILADQPLLYDPSNLTTHAVVTGMTGSGKTGLCIGMLEEAARRGIPALIVDPKGDLTNLLLHFPELKPQDFAPWIDPDLSARSGKPIEQLAEETAAQWRDGLAGWNLGHDDLMTLQEKGRYTIFTPGSSAGKPINILSSFQAPEIAWAENRELLREKISGTITAVLGLIGLTDIDPLRSREHILLANIMESAWSQAKPLDLTELILQTQTPPFQRLGAFPVDSFFPPKDRLELAMLLNNFLAAPSFQTWQEGQSLDIPALLFGPDGHPLQSIFYLAHLDDNERMFFTTLLFSAVEAWMRTQRGTGGLRALLYFDEIQGYLPPVRNPPSKPVLLRMLKQGRAFGLGLLLATQNPVDLDYKALSNAGTWFIGRLQTDQDKQRLLDGLSSAGGAVDVAEYDRLISTLQKRIFLLHSVSRPLPQLFQTRWTLNYLAGPLTRAQIPELNRLGDGGISSQASKPVSPPDAQIPQPASGMPASRPASASQSPVEASNPLQEMPPTSVPIHLPTQDKANVAAEVFSNTRQAPAAGLAEYFIPAELGISQAAEAVNISLSVSLEPEGMIYRPRLLAQAQVRYFATRYNYDHQRQVAVLAGDPPGSLAPWDNFSWAAYRPADLQNQPLPGSRFSALPAWLGDPRWVATLQRDFLDWVYRTGTIRLRANPTLKVFVGPPATTADFRDLCSQAAREAFEAEAAKIEATYDQKKTVLRQKIAHLEDQVMQQKDELDRRKAELGGGGEFFLGLLGKRKGSSSASPTKRRLAEQAKDDLAQDKQDLATLNDQLQALELVQQNVTQETQTRWAKAVDDEIEVPLVPQKKDIFLDLFGVAWLPYYQLKVGTDLQELPAFTSQR